MLSFKSTNNKSRRSKRNLRMVVRIKRERVSVLTRYSHIWLLCLALYSHYTPCTVKHESTNVIKCNIWLAYTAQKYRSPSKRISLVVSCPVVSTSLPSQDWIKNFKPRHIFISIGLTPNYEYSGTLSTARYPKNHLLYNVKSKRQSRTTLTQNYKYVNLRFTFLK